MSGGITVSVDTHEVDAALGRLGGPQQVVARRNSLMAGGRSLVGPLRSEAPARTGLLRRKVSARQQRVRSSGGIIVGRDPTSVIVGSTAHHNILVVRGTGPRYTKRGAYRGIMPSNPFVDRVWLTRGPSAIAVIKARYKAQVERLWRVR